MTSKASTPSLGRMILELEWAFLEPTLAILVGLLPFALAAVNTSGQVIAATWGAFYLLAIVATTRVYASMIWDGLRVATGREPRFIPVFERAFDENKDKIEQARAVIPRPILWLLDFVQTMNPLWLPAMVAALYVRFRSRVLVHPPGEAHLGRSDVMAYYEAKRVTRSLEPRERELLPAG